MAYTPLKISIPEPCHEDWNGMHPVAGTTARHCDSCVKNVVDFTGFSDAQMHAYVRLNGGKMCGRFRPDQLERPLRAVSRPTRNPLKVAATAAGLMLAASGCDTLSSAQNIVHEEIGVVELVEDVITEPMITGGISILEIEQPTVCTLSPPSVDGLVMGKILAPHAVPPPPPPPPMPPVIEHFEYIDDEVVGDIVFEEVEWPGDEAFELEEVTSGDTLIPVSSGANFPELVGEESDTNRSNHPPAEFEFISQEVLEEEVKHFPQQGMINGLMVVYEPEPTGLDWIRDSIKKAILPPSSAPKTTASHPRTRPDELPKHLNNLTVYPNPFVSELVVAVDLPHAQTMVVELVDPNGRQVHVESFEGIEGTNNFVIEPKRRKLVHAAYHLRVTDLLGRTVTRTVVR